MTALYSIYGETHPGHARPRNEDNFDYLLVERGRAALAVVADGVGGHSGGDVASRLAVEAAMPAFAGIHARGGSDAEAWRAALTEANARVRSARSEQPALARMATTLVGCAAREDRITVAHLGDSRAYRYRDETLTPLTRDHTAAEDMAARGLELSEAMSAAYQNVITRGIGLGEHIEPVIRQEPVVPGDCFLLCSDGLSSHVTEQRLRSCLGEGTAQTRVRALIDAALEAGGPDNITAILIIRHTQEET